MWWFANGDAQVNVLVMIIHVNALTFSISITLLPEVECADECRNLAIDNSTNLSWNEW